MGARDIVGVGVPGRAQAASNTRAITNPIPLRRMLYREVALRITTSFRSISPFDQG